MRDRDAFASTTLYFRRVDAASVLRESATCADNISAVVVLVFDIERVNVAREVAEYSQEDVDEEISSATSNHEDSNRGNWNALASSCARVIVATFRAQARDPQERADKELLFLGVRLTKDGDQNHNYRADSHCEGSVMFKDETGGICGLFAEV